jgi:hypothetical protein
MPTPDSVVFCERNIPDFFSTPEMSRISFETLDPTYMSPPRTHLARCLTHSLTLSHKHTS